MRALYRDKNRGFTGPACGGKRCYYVFATVVIVMLGLCVVRADETSSEVSERLVPPTLAVVNVSRVLSRCSQWKDSREEIEQIRAKAESTLEKLQRRIRTLQVDYENLPAGTEKAQEKREELRRAMEDYRGTGEKYEEQLSEKRDETLTRILKQINSVVEEYADEHGIEVVLKSGGMGIDDGSSPAGLRTVLQQTATADVLYATDRYDISDEIAERLDASYATAIIERPGE